MKNNKLTKLITGACLASLGTQIVVLVSYIDIFRNHSGYVSTVGWLVFALVILVIGGYLMDGIVHGIVLLLCGLQIMFLELVLAFTGVFASVFSLVFIAGGIVAIIGGASLATYSKK